MISKDIQIRLLTNDDLPYVEKIEFDSFAYPWDLQDFITFIKKPNVMGLVVTWDNNIIGFLIYQLLENKYLILNMAIEHKYRRLTIGSRLIKKIIDRLKPDKRNKIVTVVSENNLMAQMFFKKNHFLYTKTLYEYSDNNKSDAYIFEYTL